MSLNTCQHSGRSVAAPSSCGWRELYVILIRLESDSRTPTLKCCSCESLYFHPVKPTLFLTPLFKLAEPFRGQLEEFSSNLHLCVSFRHSLNNLAVICLGSISIFFWRETEKALRGFLAEVDVCRSPAVLCGFRYSMDGAYCQSLKATLRNESRTARQGNSSDAAVK